VHGPMVGLRNQCPCVVIHARTVCNRHIGDAGLLHTGDTFSFQRSNTKCMGIKSLFYNVHTSKPHTIHWDSRWWWIAHVLCALFCSTVCACVLKYWVFWCAQDLQKIRQIFRLKAQGNRASFAKDDVVAYYNETTQRDYRVLQFFSGPGLHSRLCLPMPTGINAATLVQPSLLLEHIGCVRALRVLEIGCGQGACTLFLASLCPTVCFHGIDITPKHVDIAQKHKAVGSYSNVVFSLHEATELSTLEEMGFDLIFGVEAMCHLDTPLKRHSFLTQAYSKLSSGGRVVLIDGFRSSLFSHASHHQQAAMRYAETGFRINAMPTKKEWVDLALDLNFQVAQDRDLTIEVLPFWELGWRFAHFLLHFAHLLQYVDLLHPRIAHTGANCLAVATTAHALRNRAAAEYGMLVLQRW